MTKVILGLTVIALIVALISIISIIKAHKKPPKQKEVFVSHSENDELIARIAHISMCHVNNEPFRFDIAEIIPVQGGVALRGKARTGYLTFPETEMVGDKEIAASKTVSVPTEKGNVDMPILAIQIDRDGGYGKVLMQADYGIIYVRGDNIVRGTVTK